MIAPPRAGLSHFRPPALPQQDAIGGFRGAGGWIWRARRGRIAGKAPTRRAGARLSRRPPIYRERRDCATSPRPRPLCAIRPRHAAHGRPRHNRAAQSPSPKRRLPGRPLRAGLMQRALAAGGYGHLRDRRAQDFPVAPRAYGPVSLAHGVWLLYAVNRMAPVGMVSSPSFLYTYIYF